MTEMVEVTADTKVKTIIMPSANVSSKLEIKGSSGIIVGGLNKEAVDNADKTGKCACFHYRDDQGKQMKAIRRNRIPLIKSKRKLTKRNRQTT